jgi:hypothetical protein
VVIEGLEKSLRLQARHVDRRCQPAICDLAVSIRGVGTHNNDSSILQLHQHTITSVIATAFTLGRRNERLQLLGLDEMAKETVFVVTLSVPIVCKQWWVEVDHQWKTPVYSPPGDVLARII